MAYRVAKLSSGKTFTVRVENGYLWENFCSCMLVDLYTQSMRPQNEWLQIVHCEDLQLRKNYESHKNFTTQKYFSIYGR